MILETSYTATPPREPSAFCRSACAGVGCAHASEALDQAELIRTVLLERDVPDG